MATLVRRVFALAVATLAGVACAVIVAVLVPRNYESTAEVLLTTPTGDVSDGVIESFASVADGFTSESAHVDAVRVPKTQLIRITANSESASTARDEADNAAKAFMDWVALNPGPSESPTSAEPARLATTPTGETYPPRWVWLIVGGVLGILGGIGYLFRRAPGFEPVMNADDLEDAAGAPVMGVIGRAPELAAQPLISSLPSDHPVVEATRIIRTNLQYLEDAEDIQVIAVTSALPAEGKSTTTCNLAISLAQTGLSVIVVEGDLRRPQLAQYLGVDTRVGVTSVLTGRYPIAAAVQISRVPGVDVLTSGPQPPNPAEILQTDAMADLLADLRDLYDVVVVDAPPVLPVADAAAIAANVDGVVLVARHGTTGKDQVRAAVKRLNGVSAEVIGTILTMSPRKATERYGYGYGYAPVRTVTRQSHRAERREAPREPEA